MTLFQYLDTLPRARVVLHDGTSHVGSSWGVVPAEDENGDDLGYDELIFKPEKEDGVIGIRCEDIVSVDAC